MSPKLPVVTAKEVVRVALKVDSSLTVKKEAMLFITGEVTGRG